MKLKNILTFAMSLALMVPIVTTNLTTVENTMVASAEEEYEEEYIEWDYDNLYVTEDGFLYNISKDNSQIMVLEKYDFNSIVGVSQEFNWFYNSDVIDLVIPSEINGLPVTYIRFDGDLRYNPIESIDKDGKITYYEYGGCMGLKYPYVETIQIPETVKYIYTSDYDCKSFGNLNGYDDDYNDIDSNLKEVTILNKDAEIGEGFLCEYDYEAEKYVPRDVTLIGYVGSTTEEYAKKYGFKFVDVTTVTNSNDDNKDNDNTTNIPNTPTIGDSSKDNNKTTIGDSGKDNNNTSSTTTSSTTTGKTSSPATSDNGVMPLITLGTLMGVGALVTNKKKR